MSFVNLETDNADYRVVLFKHDRPLNTSQISPNCTGVAEEGLTGFTENAYKGLEGKLAAKHPLGGNWGYIFADLRRLSQTRNFPLVHGEPLTNHTEASKFQRKFNPQDSDVPAHLLARMRVLSDSTEEIIIDSPDFQVLEESANAIRSRVTYGNLMGRLKDLLLAQAGYALSLRQEQDPEIDRPDIDIVTGTFHIGVVRCLLMTPEDRIKEILATKHIFQLYQRPEMGVHRYIAPRNGQWERSSFKDRQLRKALNLN